MATWSTQQLTFGTAFMQTVMAALKTVPGDPLINAAKVRLSVDPAFAPSPGSKISDLAPQEANYSGYAAGGIAVVLSNPVNLSNTCQGSIAEATFTATTADPFVSGSVTGYWIDDGTNFICGEAFPSGQKATFSAPGAFLALIVQIPMQAIQPTQ